MGRIARVLSDVGESTFEIQLTREGTLLLLPCTVASVTGGPNPESWRYLLTHSGPTSVTSAERPAAAVLAFRAHSPTAQPWRGKPALESTVGGSLLAGLEAQLELESTVKPARVVSVGITSEQRGDVGSLIAQGGVVAVSGAPLGSKEKAYGLGAGTIGGNYSVPGVTLHGQLAKIVSAGLGVPPDLILGGGDGAAQRESFRRFAAATIAPLLGIVRAEWQAKIAPLQIGLDGLRASDETVRARAVGSRATAVGRLVASGVPLNQALALAGVD